MNINDIEIKEDSPEKLVAITDKPTKFFLFATEINTIVEAIKNRFKTITNSDAKMIANAIGDITGGFIRIYGHNNGSGDVPKIPLLINNTETAFLKNTNQSELKVYLDSEYPLEIKTKEDLNLNLPTGKYLRIYTQVDIGYSIDKLMKNITKDTLLGSYVSNAYFQMTIENFVNDLIQAQPYTITVVNTTTFLPKIRMDATYAGQTDKVASNGKIISIAPWQNWDYTYPFWGGVDLTNEAQGFKLELYTNDSNNSLLGIGYAYAGSNYPTTYYWIGQITNVYGTRNFKLVISQL